MDPRAQRSYEVDSIPLRRDGTRKQFWYDPEHPGHIIHDAGDHLHCICVGH